MKLRYHIESLLPLLYSSFFVLLIITNESIPSEYWEALSSVVVLFVGSLLFYLLLLKDSNKLFLNILLTINIGALVYMVVYDVKTGGSFFSLIYTVFILGYLDIAKTKLNKDLRK